MALGRDPADRRYVIWSVVSLGALTLVCLLVGFVWLPSVHADFTAQGIWAAICRAAGAPASWTEQAPPPKPTLSTTVVLAATATRTPAPEAAGRGGTLALQQCAMCHGAQGVTAADTPNLAGQYPEVVFKQLVDYKSGHRRSSIMEALARNLSEQDMYDLAAYYAGLPKPQLEGSLHERPAPPLVRVGDPVRNIAPCASCHGGMDRKLGTPWLEGMPKKYLVDQLEAFATAARRNDAHAQMRNVARSMNKQEIDEVSDFYARRAAPTGHR